MSRRPITVLMSVQGNHLSLYQELVRSGCTVILNNSELYQQYQQESMTCLASSLDKRMSNWVSDVEKMAGERRFRLSGQELTRETLTAYYKLLLPSARGMFVVADTVRRIHRDHPIDICIVHNEEAPNLRMMVTTCQQLGIPTLHVVHAAFYYKHLYWDFHDRIRADRVAVESEITRQQWFLSKAYNSPEQVVVTGRPEWDCQYHRRPPSRESMCAKLGLDPSRPTLSVVGSWVGPNLRNMAENSVAALRYLFEAVRDLKGVEPQIAVRPHPGHAYSGTFGPDVYRELAAQFGVEIHLVPGDLQDFIDVASVVFSLESTVNGIAMIQKKPVISVTNTVLRANDPNWKGGLWGQFEGVLGCYVDRDMITTAVNTAFCDEEYLAKLPAVQQRMMDELNVGNDGRATERIIALVYQMIDEAAGRTLPVSAVSEPVGNPLAACSTEGEPLAIIGEHTTRFLCIPDWRTDGWQQVVMDYFRAYRGRRDTALVVRVEPLLPEMVELAQQVLVAAIEGSGLASDEVPDVILEATPLDQEQRPGLFRACQFYVSVSDQDDNAAHAKACGTDVITSVASVDTVGGQVDSEGQGGQVPSSLASPERPSVSVLMVTYNSSQTITACLASVARELGPRDELVILDNASGDETCAHVEAFASTTDVQYQLPKE